MPDQMMPPLIPMGSLQNLPERSFQNLPVGSVQSLPLGSLGNIPPSRLPSAPPPPPAWSGMPPTQPFVGPSMPAISSSYALPRPVPSTITGTTSQQVVTQPLSIPESHVDCPHPMSPDEYEEYKDKLGTLRQIEGYPRPQPGEVTYTQPLPFPEPYCPKGVEKDLLTTQSDQFEQRLRYLEKLANHTSAQYNDKRMPMDYGLGYRDGAWFSTFNDKFIPMQLGLGWNNTYYNFYDGVYIERDKIAQREAQLKHLSERHQHPGIYWFAGIEKDDIDDDYWDRDINKFMEDVRKEQMLAAQFQPQFLFPMQEQQRLVMALNQQAQRQSMMDFQNNSFHLQRQFTEGMSGMLGNRHGTRSSMSYPGYM